MNEAPVKSAVFAVGGCLAMTRRGAEAEMGEGWPEQSMAAG